jgi:flagella basal body P-ring formation protein FlgA
MACRTVGRGSLSQVRVRVTATVNGQEQGYREVLFRLQYPHRCAVATQNLAAGQVLTEKDFRIETTLKPEPQAANWQPPVGLLTRQAVARGTLLSDRWIQQPVVPVAIKRNQSVVIHIQQPGLSISAMGQALADACTGEMLKVKNTDSHRIILCRVEEDGSVSPVL